MSTPWLLPCVALALALALSACANTAPPQQGGGASSSRGVQLNNRGHALAGQGQHAAAVALYREALPMMPADGASAANRAATLNNLGASLATLGALVEAQQAFSEALQIRERLFGPLAAPTLLSRHNLGVVLGRRGQAQPACEQARQAWRRRVQTLGAGHPDTLASRASVQSLAGCALA
ncbi:tetratricopeptide repeat protein [Variovorax sp. DT-64]|uniref:tetratricopeptide repeat protein n=1 Tax=Variovorax sp. DT-64 TaxID=3396160 RepID=UPI003F1C665A